MKNTEISRFIAFILRHKPESVGIKLDPHGWASVSELISAVSKRWSFNMEKLEEIVATDDKMRYSFNSDKTLIRANQGHSVPVDLELCECDAPTVLYHGTAEKYTEALDEEGLISKTRLFVHLSGDIETAAAVGKRHGTPVIYEVASSKMQKDGHKFYLSENGVWLTPAVPAKYLKKISN